MSPTLFTVSEDAQSRLLLVSNNEEDRIVLSFFEGVAFEFPVDIHLARRNEPAWSRQAADDHGLEHNVPPVKKTLTLALSQGEREPVLVR
jgi:hypothetical protein